MILTAPIILAAVLLDRAWGEPKRWHPLPAFGRLVERVETHFYQMPEKVSEQASGHQPDYAAGQISHLKKQGILALLSLLLPIALIVWLLMLLPGFAAAISVVLLYLCLGQQSLTDHTLPIADALEQGDEVTARALVSKIVSRDPEALDINIAATESVLENGSDAVFAALFWFIVAGPVGVVVYRMVNTLDAMWGYKSERYREFGWAAARLDDVLNYIPARLTAWTYAVLGNTKDARQAWRYQGHLTDSPNAGVVMAAGAGALGVQIGGKARYAGKWRIKPTLGFGAVPKAIDIRRAIDLVNNGVWLWIAVIAAFAICVELLF